MENSFNIVSKYIDRHLFTIEKRAEQFKQSRKGKNINTKKVPCKLVSIIADDIQPRIATSIIGQSILYLKILNKVGDGKGKEIYLPYSKIESYNDSVVNHCINLIRQFTTSQNISLRNIVKTKNKNVKETYEAIANMKNNQNKTKNELIDLTSEKLDMNFSAVKSALYYKPKKV